ncbi:MAG: ATP-binding protein [Candidatus Eremiobacteraeota bacterium]|nr:ATP-binding protein [Candidatus Eremiobacteraeota bacterium]
MTLIFSVIVVGGFLSRSIGKGDLRGPSVEARLAQTANSPLLPLPPDLERSLRADLTVEIEHLEEIKTEWDKLDSASASAADAPSDDWLKRQSELRSLLRDRAESKSELVDGYLEIRERWSKQVHEVLAQLRQPPREADREALPPFNFSAYNRVRDSEEGLQYRQKYLELESRAYEFRNQRAAGKEARLERRSTQVRDLNLLRASYLDQLFSLGYAPALESNSHFSEDIAMEVQTIPTRLAVIFKLREMRYRRYLSAGIDGYRALFSELIFLLFALGLPFGAIFLQRWWLRERRRLTPIRVRGYQSQGELAWLAIALLLFLEFVLLRDSLLHDLGLLFLLASFYSLYRSCLAVALGTTPLVVRALRGDEPERTAIRWKRSAKYIARFLLIGTTLLALAEGLTTRGLLYHGIARIFFLLSAFSYVLLAFAWRREQSGAWPSLLGSTLGGQVSRLTGNPVLALLICPLLLPLQLTLAGIRSLAQLSLRYEWSKPLMAGFLRRWIQATALFEDRELAPVPSDYREAFLALKPDSGELFPDDHPLFLELMERSRTFAEGGEVEPIVVVGDAGAGKSVLLEKLRMAAADLEVEVRHWKLQRRTVDTEPCITELKALFGVNEERDLQEALLKGPPTILVLEELESLFLARVRGFQAVNYLLELIRALQGRVMLVASCRRVPFEYLTKALGPQIGLPYPYHVPRFSDQQLRTLILARHQATGVPFRFDREIYGVSTEAESEEGLDRQFFQILWEQSQGNPAAASALWLESLSADPEQPGGVLVGVPPVLSSRLFVESQDDELFLLASLARHGSLDGSEITMVAGMGRKRVDSILPRWLRAGIVEERDGTYQIHIEYEFLLTRYLKGRNFLNAR